MPCLENRVSPTYPVVGDRTVAIPAALPELCLRGAMRLPSGRQPRRFQAGVQFRRDTAHPPSAIAHLLRRPGLVPDGVLGDRDAGSMPVGILFQPQPICAKRRSFVPAPDGCAPIPESSPAARLSFA